MATVYDIETALEYILTAQYGKDVRQAIHDAIHACFDEGGSGSIDLSAREGIQNLTLEVEAALNEMNLHSGRTKLLDDETIATADSTMTMPKPFTEFDSVWIHVSNATGSSNAPVFYIGSYKVPVGLPMYLGETTAFDILITCITSNTAVVKFIGQPTNYRDGINAKVFMTDEFPLASTDASGTALDMTTRNFKITNCSGAKVSVVGHGDKGSDTGEGLGLVLDTSGVVHLV